MRIGVDFGGTKIEAAALTADGAFSARLREPNPGDYDAAIATVGRLIARVETETGMTPGGPVGLAVPGSPSPQTGLMRNANSTELNGRPFPADLSRVLNRPVRYANDANCLALSEAADGAGAGHRVVLAVILGTGCGAGVTVGGQIIEGRNAIAGEWGHMPLPWPTAEEYPGPMCWCGRRNCMELWVSGTGFARDHRGARNGEDVLALSRSGDTEAAAALDRYVHRLARGLAVVCDVLDPDAIVLGGGMSNVDELYERLPGAIAPLVFSDVFTTPILRATHGDSSGVRGAARLWPLSP